MGTAPSRTAAPAAAARSEGTARTSKPFSWARPLAVAQPIRSRVKLPGPSPSTIPSRSARRAAARVSTKSTSRRISAAWRRAPCAWVPASTVAPVPTATLAMSVAVSIASQRPLIPAPPKCGMRSAECEIEQPGSILEAGSGAGPPSDPLRIPHSAFRIREPAGASSRDLLQLPGVRIGTVAQFEVPVERRHPRTGALGPLDQDDGALALHVLEAEILRLVRGAEPVAVDVVDGAATGGGGGAGVGGTGRGGGGGARGAGPRARGVGWRGGGRPGPRARAAPSRAGAG